MLTQFELMSRLLSNMESLLQKEQQALQTIDPEGLSSLTNSKNQLVQDIAAAENELTLLLKQHQDNANPARAEQNYFQLAEHAIQNASPNWQAKLSTAWKALLNQAAQCKQKNLVNGIAIHTGIQTTQKITRIFQPDSPDSNTYDRKGQIET